MDVDAEATALEAAYLRHDDPILQSGFGGGAERWRAERGPILDAVGGDGTILDVGCANGYLLECLVAWARERDGTALTPYGVDIGPRLIEVARRRQPAFATHFFAADARTWIPPRRFRYVYAICDSVPLEGQAAFARRLLELADAPGARLIVGAYGSRSRGLAPLDVGGFLRSAGLAVAGESEGGEEPITRFAWIDRVVLRK